MIAREGFNLLYRDGFEQGLGLLVIYLLALSHANHQIFTSVQISLSSFCGTRKRHPCFDCSSVFAPLPAVRCLLVKVLDSAFLNIDTIHVKPKPKPSSAGRTNKSLPFPLAMLCYKESIWSRPLSAIHTKRESLSYLSANAIAHPTVRHRAFHFHRNPNGLSSFSVCGCKSQQVRNHLQNTGRKQEPVCSGRQKVLLPAMMTFPVMRMPASKAFWLVFS